MSDFKISKHISRLAAVQVMYQKDITGLELDGIIDNFVNFYLNHEEEYKGINLKFFKSLISHFKEEIDFTGIVSRNIDNGKSFATPSVIASCIIKVAILEMMFEKTDIPVIINEYVELSKDFVDKKGVNFTNAILDKISKQIERKCQEKA